MPKQKVRRFTLSPPSVFSKGEGNMKIDFGESSAIYETRRRKGEILCNICFGDIDECTCFQDISIETSSDRNKIINNNNNEFVVRSILERVPEEVGVTAAETEIKPDFIKSDRSEVISKNIKKRREVFTMNYITKETSIDTQLDFHRLNLNKKKKSNVIITSKYTWWTFIPLNLWFQFHLFANIYFLIASVLQMIPEISDTNGKPLTLLPLSFVICLSGARDLIEDKRRHKQDKTENETNVIRIRKCRSNCFDIFINEYSDKINKEEEEEEEEKTKKELEVLEVVQWKDLLPGDIVKLFKDELVPADIVVLSSSDSSGAVYVDTMNLDGESNLKQKIALSETNPLISDDIKASIFEARITCEVPNIELYSFSGEIEIASNNNNNNNINNISCPLKIDQLLLRGSTIRTVEYCYGIVVYTGHETRIQMNTGKSGRYKISKLMATYNNHVIRLFAFQFLICTICAGAHAVYSSNDSNDNSQTDNNDNSGWYFNTLDINVAFEAVKVFGRMLLQFTYFVPISLLVSLEMVKYAQASFINKDERMRSPILGLIATKEIRLLHRKEIKGNKIKIKESEIVDNDTKGLNPVTEYRYSSVNNSTLGEELGVVSHIFSDKTGTLTENLMLFSSLVIFGYPSLFFQESAIVSRDSHVSDSFDINQFIARARAKESEGEYLQRVRDVLVCLSVCHTVLRNRSSIESEDESFVDSSVMYDASSPDELALVAGVRELGVEFSSRPSSDRVSLIFTNSFASELFGAKSMTWRLLEVLPFDNYRKRMSVLVQLEDIGSLEKGTSNKNQLNNNYYNNSIYLFTKGADSSILSVSSSHNEMDNFNLDSSLASLSVIGLRTLVYGVRVFSDESSLVLSDLNVFNSEIDMHLNNYAPMSLREWRTMYRELTTTNENIDSLNICLSLIECNISILGCSGIEDRLQEGVPETIVDLHAAGIKLWVLTGDKIETAINIGNSCNLLGPSVLNQVIDTGNTNEISSIITQCEEIVKNRNIEIVEMQEDNEIGLISDVTDDEFKSTDDIIETGIDGIEILSDVNSVVDEREPESNINNNNNNNNPTFSHLAITLSGVALAVILRHRILRRRFFSVTLSACSTVIACRVSPSQKAEVVRWASHYLPQKTMLSIGDGSNDVPMILEADVGVGVIGNEGSQAVRSADYAIPQFRFISRLLFLHGRECVRKNSFFVYFTVYKNVAFSIPQFLFGFVSRFSGTNLYDPILKQGFNILYSFIPIIVYAILDHHLPVHILSKSHILYAWRNNYSFHIRMENIFGGIRRLQQKFNCYNKSSPLITEKKESKETKDTINKKTKIELRSEVSIKGKEKGKESLPVISRGTDLPLYGTGRLYRWLALALWTGVCCFMIPLVCVNQMIIPGEPPIVSIPLEHLGVLVFFNIIIVTNLIIYLWCSSHNFFIHFSIWFGIISYLSSWAILSTDYTDLSETIIRLVDRTNIYNIYDGESRVSGFESNLVGSFYRVLLTPSCLFIILSSVTTTLFPLIAIYSHLRIFHPENSRIARERVSMGEKLLFIGQDLDDDINLLKKTEGENGVNDFNNNMKDEGEINKSGILMAVKQKLMIMRMRPNMKNQGTRPDHKKWSNKTYHQTASGFAFSEFERNDRIGLYRRSSV